MKILVHAILMFIFNGFSMVVHSYISIVWYTRFKLSFILWVGFVVQDFVHDVLIFSLYSVFFLLFIPNWFLSWFLKLIQLGTFLYICTT